MKLLFPNNVFALMFKGMLRQNEGSTIQFKDASVLSSELENGNADISLIPSCDLIKHSDFYISGKAALSFDGLLSNSLFYFVPEQNKFSDLYLKGDITTNEIILSKVLFKERYSSDVQIHLETGPTEFGKKNYLIAGDYNFKNENFNKGLSFSDELSTLLFLPYVNFVIASKEQRIIEEFNDINADIENDDEDSIDIFKNINLEESAKTYLKDNLSSVYFGATETEMEGLKEMLLLPYYHGITDEPLELKII